MDFLLYRKNLVVVFSHIKKIKIQILCLCLPFFIPIGAGAKSVIYKYDVSQDIKSIRIQAHQAHIELIKRKDKKQELKVQYSGELEKEEEGDVFIVSVEKFPDEKLAWKKTGKRPTIKVWAPARNLEVAVFGGKVLVDKFADVNLSVFMAGKGSVHIKRTTGELKIFQSSGTINLDSHKGNITIQEEDSLVSLNACKGKINIRGLKGHLEVSKSSGYLDVQSFKAPLVLRHFAGQLSFQQEKGGVYFKPMIGSVSGFSREGELRGTLQPNEVDLKTDTGKIHLDFPYSRAWLTAETWEGRIFTPIYFHRVKTGGMDRSRGRLRGSKHTGKVSLKSRSGSIRVYQSVN